MKLILDPEVHIDILDAMEYYEAAAGPLLATEFHSEVKRVFQQIRTSPYSFAIRNDEFRRVNLARFPYNIVYRIIDDTSVRILTVRHDRRDPDHGLDR